jgi:alpha-L-rhamnosidase
LGFASGTYLSPYGKISSSWKHEENRVLFEIEIPANMKARVLLPNGDKHEVCTGKYSFVVNE